MGADATAFQKADVGGARFGYPRSAPALVAGTRYTLEVEATSGPVQRSSFEMVDAARAAAIRRDLENITSALGPNASVNTVALVRAGLLLEQRLLHDARETVLGALAKDSDEPSLHTLLGQIYEKSGLRQQAAESFDEARYLLTRGMR